MDSVKDALASCLLPCLFVLFFVSAPVAADAAEPDLSESAPSFWKVEGANNTLWLFGSVHVLTGTHYPLAEEVEAAFDAAPNLVVETDVVHMDPRRQQQLMASAGRLPEGTTLEDVLGTQRHAQAQELSAANGYPLARMSTLRPWLIALVLSANEFQRLGYTPEHGVEAYFLRRAAQERKSIRELETLAFQIALFEGLDEEIEIAFLMQTLEEIDGMHEQIETLIDAWAAGSLEDLRETLMAEFEGYPELYERIVTERNHAWMADLTRILEEEEGDHFVVVGALHMVGEDGLVNLLREAGYSVQLR